MEAGIVLCIKYHYHTVGEVCVSNETIEWSIPAVNDLHHKMYMETSNGVLDVVNV
jgi:hypothetical protein